MRKHLLRQIGIFGVILILSLTAGGKFTDGPRSDEMEKVLQTDKKLSQKVDSGGCKVLLEYLAKESCLLPRNGHHIKGRKNFQEILNKAKEKNLRCIARWEPFEGRVSSSGTLAYTYGRYRIDSQANPKEDNRQYNYYASIWKKHTSGEWQILFNLGLLDLEEWRDWDSLSNALSTDILFN